MWYMFPYHMGHMQYAQYVPNIQIKKKWKTVVDVRRGSDNSKIYQPHHKYVRLWSLVFTPCLRTDLIHEPLHYIQSDRSVLGTAAWPPMSSNFPFTVQPLNSSPDPLQVLQITRDFRIFKVLNPRHKLALFCIKKYLLDMIQGTKIFKI